MYGVSELKTQELNEYERVRALKNLGKIQNRIKKIINTPDWANIYAVYSPEGLAVQVYDYLLLPVGL